MSKYKLYILLLFIVLTFKLDAQFFIIQDTTNNNISYGFDKFANTLNFIGNADINYITKFGSFYLKQNYTGTSISNANTFRDDEKMTFGYYLPVYRDINFISQFNWMLNTDTRSIGVNELQRINGAAGISYEPSRYFNIYALGGIEDNTQIGVNSKGTIYKTRANLNNFDLDGYTFNGRANAEIINLDNDRNNSDISFNFNAYKNYGLNDNINLDMNYKYLARDFLISTFANLDDFMIESRLENRYGGNFGVQFDISERFISKFDLSFSHLHVSRAYRDFILSESQTGISRELNELQIDLSANFKYIGNDIYQNLTIQINSRDEDNFIRNKFNIDETELNRLRNVENQRDNISRQNSIISTTVWDIDRKNNLKADYNISLLRYDTPSDNNNDDRDELSSIARLTYSRRYSRFLTLDLVGEYQLHHLVFLRAERSALNNMNRILKFSPVVYLTYYNFRMEPRLEVLANYTVFDFEDINPNVRSYSFRQISYKDSLRLGITDKVKLKSRLLYRYFERGILYWTSFRETPQNSNREILTDVMLVNEISKNLEIGLGIKYYNLNQQNLGLNSSIVLDQESIGPRVTIVAYFLKGSILSVTGWYEFQKSTDGVSREIPNLYLNTTINL